MDEGVLSRDLPVTQVSAHEMSGLHVPHKFVKPYRESKQEEHAMPQRTLALLTLAVFAFALAAPASAALSIVEDGKPNAEIVIAERPPRMAKLAAQELQSHIEKISGARLPIVTQPTRGAALRVYVGRSRFTDALGIDDRGLKYGAFRMRTVKDGLVLIGHDEDFTPKQPYAMGRRDAKKMYARWDAITGDTLGNPRGILYRRYSKKMGLWEYDQGGSLNAVYEFLRGLGVRWYMPGELGTIIPRTKTIALPRVDRVVRPEFNWRMVTISVYFSSGRDDILWYLRQGWNHGEVIGHWSHGLRNVTSRPETMEKHPEYYALLRGVRLTKTALGHGNQPCLSSEGLVKAAVRFGRAMYDTYGLPMVSMMPQDGFQFCECRLCKGKDTPKRGREGMHSDYVWGFVNRVAKELYKTHPNRGVNCLAYGTYQQPPETIERLSPNVYVGIIHGRGRTFDDPKSRARSQALIAAWRKKTDSRFWTWEHYPFTHRSASIPFYYPHAIAGGIRAIRKDFLGEFIEGPIGPFKLRGHGLHAPGFGHLNFYVTGRFQWDADQDVDALLNEYYRLFYGPAASQMKAFTEYCEANRRDMRQDVKKMDKALALFDAAAKAAPAGSVYGRRIALVADYLKGMRKWRAQLGRGRVNVPVLKAPVRRGARLKLDGRLDDAVWRDLPSYPLVDVKTGKKAKVGTTFKLFWDGGERAGHMVFGIRCEEPDMANLRTLTKDTGDWRLFNADNVELLIETHTHSYYQTCINALGAVMDLDRHLGHRNDKWSSMARVGAHRGKDYWSLEVRIPVTGEDSAGDPLHEVVGKRPTADAPWHINIGRQRLRGENREWTIWSPTGSNFHNIMRFGRVE